MTDYRTPEPSDHARSFVGRQIHYEGNRPNRNVSGTVVDVEFAGCTVTNERGTWLGIRFKIKPVSGRAFWTHALPDMPSEDETSETS